MLWNGSGKFIQQVVCFWLWGKAIEIVFWLNQRRAVREDGANSAAATILKLKHTKSGFYVTICHEVKVFAFLYVKTNSKEICAEIYFPFFAVNCWRQHFYSRFNANYLGKIPGYPLAEIYEFHMVLIKTFVFSVDRVVFALFRLGWWKQNTRRGQWWWN